MNTLSSIPGQAMLSEAHIGFSPICFNCPTTYIGHAFMFHKLYRFAIIGVPSKFYKMYRTGKYLVDSSARCDGCIQAECQDFFQEYLGTPRLGL